MDNLKNFNGKTHIAELNEGIKKIKLKSISLCQYCYRPARNNDLIKCSTKECKAEYCKDCITYIDHFPFCADCVVNIVKNKTLLIVTKNV